jgi:hypothetical protein
VDLPQVTTMICDELAHRPGAERMVLVPGPAGTAPVWADLDAITIAVRNLIENGLRHGAPIRSDQGPEFIAAAVKAWIAGVGARTAYIEQASLCRPQSRSLRSARRRPAPRRAPAASPPAGVERLARPTGVRERRELVEQRLASHRETPRIQGLPRIRV